MNSCLIAALLFATAGSAPTPLTFEAIIERAEANSPEIRELAAEVVDAQATASIADAFRTTASVATTPGYATSLPTPVLGQVPSIASVDVRRLFYDPAQRADHLITKGQIDLAVARLEQRKREIAREVTDLAARLVADDSLIDAAGKRVAALQLMARHADSLAAEGRLRPIDVERGRLQLAMANRKADHLVAQRRLDAFRLQQMVGSDVAVTVETPSGEQQMPSIDEAIGHDRQLKTTEARIIALEQAVVMSRRMFAPSIAGEVEYSRLFDRYRRYYLDFKPNDLSAGLTFSIPIWTGGGRAAASARLHAELDAARAEHDLRVKQITMELTEAMADLHEAEADADLAGRARAIAGEGLRVAQELSTEGRGEADDIPRAEIELADASDELANATVHQMAARARVSIAAGALPH